MRCIALSFIILLINTFESPSCFSQSGTITGSGTVVYNQDGSVTVNGTKTFTSHVIGPDEDIENMIQFNAIGLFRINADLSGGIKALAAGGRVTLTVFSYDSSSATGKGNILYRLTSTASDEFSYRGMPENIPSPAGSGSITSDQIKTLLRGANTWLVDPLNCYYLTDPDLFTSTMAYINGQIQVLQTPLNDCLKGNNYALLQPVIVEVNVTNARVMSHGLKFPGLEGDFDLADYFNPERLLEVVFKVNGEYTWTYVAGKEDGLIQSLIMGDSITFEVKYRGRQEPRIKGVPGVWIARFAGDLMYYCSPNVSPGEFQPWIGYDSRVHNLQMRNYNSDPTFQERVPSWKKPGNNTFSWSWIAQRRMSSLIEKYEAEHTWPKYKVLDNGGIQRNNQREGLNVQFLNYWQSGENSDFREYSGQAQYMMGFDDDELLYLDSQHHDAVNFPPPPPPMGGIVKLDSIASRGMPEGAELIYDTGTGYPAQGFPLNMVISAYRKNREWVVNKNENYFQRYDGYEIQDIGTSEMNPDGMRVGNKVAPGKITVRAGNKVVRIPISVWNPLYSETGFYGDLEGTTWPGYYELSIPYTLKGLQNLDISVLDCFSMEYAGSDPLGNLSTQTKYLRDLSTQEKANIASTGRWAALFDNTSPTYASITAYYQRTPGSERVIVAGKELKSIFLLFIGEKNLEGKGLGAKIWLNDFRNTSTAEYNVPRKFGNKTRYMKPFVRSYVFPTNTTTIFNAWDGDPHLFYDSGVEWYLSSRSLAKRIPENFLDGTDISAEKPYLKYYVNGVELTVGRRGKDFIYTWSTPGKHELKVEYRVSGHLTTYRHEIIIIDHPTTSLGKQLGRIAFRNLTSQEARWLGASTSVYKVAEVVDLYSQYQYKDGPRANTPYTNRWAEHNDYAGQYDWNVETPVFVKNFIIQYSNRYWFWYDWALHYSSNWRDNLPYGLPVYVPNSLVTRVKRYELDSFSEALKRLFNSITQAKWQYTVPLVSYTDFQGYRMRTNPSCLYDINKVWSNIDGAFTGKVILPDDPIQIQAPDITDEQKDMQEFYYDLKSGRIAIINSSTSEPTYVTVRNIYGGQNTFIAEGYYK